MSIEVQLFHPTLNYVFTSPTSGTNQAIAQPASQTNSMGHHVLRVANNATGPVEVSWGMSTQASVVGTTSVVVLSGATELFDMGIPATNVSALLISGAGNVYISVGSGS